MRYRKSSFLEYLLHKWHKNCLFIRIKQFLVAEGAFNRKLNESSGSQPMSVAESMLAIPSGSLAGESTASKVSTGANEWYCKANGQELGPLSFDELVEFVARGHLDTSNDVKLGANGVWRPMGTVGRLATVLSGQKSRVISVQPAAASPKPVVSPRAKPHVPEAARKSASEPAKSPAVILPLAAQPPAATGQSPVAAAAAAQTPVDPISVAGNVIQPAELALIKAQAAYDAIEQAVSHLIGWTSGPSCNPQWWAVISGEPLGPDSFSRIFELVVSGRMQPTDFVRNGIYGQFSPVGNLPGVISAAIILRQARDAFELAKSNAAQLAALTPTIAAKPAVSPAAPTETKQAVAQPNGANTPDVVKPAAVPTAGPERSVSEPSARTTPQFASQSGNGSYSASGGFSSSKATSSSPGSFANRPRPTMPSRSSSSFFESLTEKLGGISIYGSIAVVAVGLLIAGAKYLPLGGGNSADTQRYNQLKQLLAEIRAKREAKSTDFADIKSKAEKLTTEFTPALKSQISAHNPAKQHLLWAVRDDLPKLMKEQLTVETKAEKNFIDRLGYVAMHLKIKHN
jgi:GYF domain 2